MLAFENDTSKKLEFIKEFAKKNKDWPIKQHKTYLPKHMLDVLIYHYMDGDCSYEIHTKCIELIESIPVGFTNWMDIVRQWFTPTFETLFEDNIVEDEDLIQLKNEILKLNQNPHTDREKWSNLFVKSQNIFEKIDNKQIVSANKNKSSIITDYMSIRKNNLKKYYSIKDEPSGFKQDKIINSLIENEKNLALNLTSIFISYSELILEEMDNKQIIDNVGPMDNLLFFIEQTELNIMRLRELTIDVYFLNKRSDLGIERLNRFIKLFSADIK